MSYFHPVENVKRTKEIIFFFKLLIYLLSEFLFLPLVAQDLVINEVMPSNSTTLRDADGDYTDWFELYNRCDSLLDLGNYAVSDDPLNPDKWILPKITIRPFHHILIFASGKDRWRFVNHWETVIDMNDEWRYIIGDISIPYNWYKPQYDEFTEPGWQTGASGFGYGDGDDSTIISPAISVYTKKRFVVEDTSQITQIYLHVDFDDSFIAYLNGLEIARENIGRVGIPVGFGALANEQREAVMYQSIPPNAYEIVNFKDVILQGENVLSVQVHNVTPNSSDMSLISLLTFGMTSVPINARGISQFLEIQRPRLHTNFKLKASGEKLLLSSPAGQVIDQVTTDNMISDISYGRQPDGSEDWFFFQVPTPDATNDTPGFTGVVKEVQFSDNGGIYQNSFSVELMASALDIAIHYEMDGRVPTLNSPHYTTPILISNNPQWPSPMTIIRARAFRDGWIPSRTVTHSYYVNPVTELPILSLVSDPDNFFSNDSGIYAFGDDAVAEFPFWGANFWSKCPQDASTSVAFCPFEPWEKPVHVDFFEPGGDMKFSIEAGARIIGHWARGLPQKSLAIFARGRYGDPVINYRIFPDLPIDQFQAFVLRNSGQDWTRTMLRDAFHHSQAKTLDIDRIAYRPSVLFVNGVYWGIHNIREKINEHYLASHHDIDPDKVDLLEDKFGLQVISGDKIEYLQMLDFVETNDLSIAENYANVKQLIDIDDLIDYTIHQTFFITWDWPGGNIKYWRPQTPDGQWRWILTDTDYGSSFLGYPPGNEWQPPSTNFFTERLDNWLFFSKLVENAEYRNKFINHFADRLNTIYHSEFTLSLFDSLKSNIEAEMPAHIGRWGGSFEYPPFTHWLGHSINSIGEWEANTAVISNFAEERPQHVLNHLMQRFSLLQQDSIEFNITAEGQGKVLLNSLLLDSFPWNGNYFNSVPIQVTALPNAGYRFVHWSGDINTDSSTIMINVDSRMSVTAEFVDVSIDTSSVVINEINYNSDENTFNPEDWVELYNTTNEAIDLSGWMFKDEENTHIFSVPFETVLASDTYLVLCRDSIMFKMHFPMVNNFLGNTGFGFSSNGELLRLFNSAGEVIDSLTYDDQPPWPVEPDGTGPTLALKNPQYDNSLAKNWVSSLNHGTPGAKNEDVFLAIESTTDLPTTFSLLQNSPNPFNPTTTIRFELPEAALLTLKIYNVMGQQVRNLIAEQMEAGYHSVLWDAHNNYGIRVGSGIYFYQMSAGNFVQTRKMLLIK